MSMACSVRDKPDLLGAIGQPQLASAKYDDALAGIARIAADCAKSVRHETEEENEAVLLILRIWEATAHAILKELESGKNVKLPPLGFFKSRASIGALGGVDRAGADDLCASSDVCFVLADDFADRYGLFPDLQALEESEIGPSIRFSCVGVARAVAVSKEVVQSALAAVMLRIGEAMASQALVIISFAPLGILYSKEGAVTLQPVLRDFGALSSRSSLTVRGALITKETQMQRPAGQQAPQPTASPGSTQQRSGEVRFQCKLPISAKLSGDTKDPPVTAQGLMEGNFHRMLPEENVRYPPLLNEYSRTLAVPFTGAQEPGSPSGRIAASYTSTAVCLTSRLPGLNSRSLRWYPDAEDPLAPTLPTKTMDFASMFKNQYVHDGSPLDLEIQDAGIAREDFYECLYRYNHYVNESVPSEYIAPFNPVWMNNIGALLDVRIFIEELTAEHVDQMMSDMHEEVMQDYLRAIRKAIVDHIFGDARARNRARVPYVPSPPMPWGTVAFVGVEGTHGGPPEEWRASLRESRACVSTALSTCSQSSLRLLELWHQQFDGLLLVALPARANAEMVELCAFCAAQSAHYANVRHEFDEAWLHSVVGILQSRRVDGATAAQESSFFEAVSALLSTQARSIIERSIDAYVGFFNRFARESPMKPQEVVRLTGSGEREDAFLILGLTAEHDDIRFSTPLDDVGTSLLCVFRDFVMCMRQLERPDAKLGKHQSGSRYLWEVSLDEQHVVSSEKFITDAISINVVNAENALTLYDDYKHLLHEEVRTRELAENLTLTREDYMVEVDKLRATESAIRDNCPNEIRLQMVSIDCAELNETLCKKATEAVQILLHAVLRNLLLKNDQLVKSFDTVRNHMVKKPTSEVELVDLESHVEEFRASGLRGLLGEFASIRSWLNFLFECEDRLCWNLLSDRHYRAIYESATWVHSIDNIVTEREANLRREREALESKFKEQRNKFIEDLEGFNANVDKFQDCGNMRQVDDYLERMQILRNHFARAHLEAEKLNDKEMRLGWVPSTFQQLKRGEEALEPHQRLWTVAFNLDKASKQWLRGPMFQLDPVRVEAEANSMRQEALQLKTLFEELNQQTPAGVAAQLEMDMSKMTATHLGLVHSLCNNALRQRHWEHISEIVGFSIEPDNVFTLARIDEMGIGKYMTKLHAISEAATKEREIEVALDAMLAEWKPVQFVLHPWRQTGSCVITKPSIEEMQGLADDHLVKTRGMRLSPHVVPWAQRAAEWQDWLELCADILRNWEHLQSSWSYLEPVFSARDILRQMPTEGQLFRKVDEVWRSLMKEAGQDSAVLNITKIDGLRERLAGCCSKLDEVSKGLNDYLEAKRLAFARFFFLSNDELLEILADAQDPIRVQRHLHKCFEGIHSLQFMPDQASCARAMVSPDGEEVSFRVAIELETSEGGAEEWFTLVQATMFAATRQMCFDTLARREEKDQKIWVQESPLQAIVCVHALCWTQEVTTALGSSLKELHNRLDVQLRELVLLARKDLKPTARKAIEAMIILDMHHASIVQKLHEADVMDEHDFDWLVQLRYYVEMPHDEVDDAQETREIMASIMFSHLPYSYEYISDCGRLVPTPLTDRVQRSLCSALHFLYGASVEGRAGTGKSETVKDLAKSLARACIVFNCSDGLDVNAMSGFFKGAASSGSWLCFEEFDRIQIEVLSVVAQQILTVQQAILRKSAHFDFEGITLQLKHTFITVTTTAYGVRTQLPDNLKALFRPAAMMVADSAIIAEAKLLSFGFIDAQSLATKIVVAFKLCEDQLSVQPHYDYSLRAILAVLNTASSLKHQTHQTEIDDTAIVALAIWEMNMSKLTPDDLDCFQHIICDLFPATSGKDRDGNQTILDLLANEKQEHSVVRNAFRERIVSQELQPVGYLDDKAIQLYEMTLARHGVIAVGQTRSGKSTSLFTLASALTVLAETTGCEFGVKVTTINPLSLTTNQLFGAGSGTEWSDGLLVSVFRSILNDSSCSTSSFSAQPTITDRQCMSVSRRASISQKHHHWLHLDGPVYAQWAESLNTVLDDSRRLCLLSGETIKVPPEMRTIFEVMDLAHASPATISRCGTVFFSPQELGYLHLLMPFLGALPITLEAAERDEVSSMIHWLVPALLKVVMGMACAHVVQARDQLLVQGMLDMLQMLFMPLWEIDTCTTLRGRPACAQPSCRTTLMSLDVPSNNGMLQHLDACVILACIWGIGAATFKDSDRTQFDEELRNLTRDEHDCIPAFKEIDPEIPEEDTVFDYAWDSVERRWCGWMDIHRAPQELTTAVHPHKVVIRTPDMTRSTHLAWMACKAQMQMMYCGSHNTGKTTYMADTITNLCRDEGQFSSMKLMFSSWTHVNAVQDTVDDFLQKRGRDAFGPAAGMKCAIFVDDMSLPPLGRSTVSAGGQQPLELLRQFCCSGGWYERGKKHKFRRVIDCFLMATVRLPGQDDGGSSSSGGSAGACQEISPRLQRHFLVVCLLPMHETSLFMVYSKILQHRFALCPNQLGLVRHSLCLLEGTIYLHADISAKLRPSPSKPHYVFALDDIARVTSGLLRLNIQDKFDTQKYTRLWVHECFRTFSDRLVSDEDQTAFLGALRSAASNCEGVEINETDLTSSRPLFTCVGTNQWQPERSYDEVMDQSRLQRFVEESLEEHVALQGKPSHLVMFEHTTKHMLRIARIIQAPLGCALLIGSSGTGRNSLTHLASYIVGNKTIQYNTSRPGYDLHEWRTNIKQLLRNCIDPATAPQTFIFSCDSQGTQDTQTAYLEDLHNLLTSGEVPLVFSIDERSPIIEQVQQSRIDALRGVHDADDAVDRREDEGIAGRWAESEVNLSWTASCAHLAAQCREHLRIVLTASPVGVMLRRRLQQLPVILHRCSIDWFHEWPASGLESVAKLLLDTRAESSLELPDNCATVLQKLHLQATAMSSSLFVDTGRHYYVTPAAYFDLIGTFLRVLSAKQFDASHKQGRYAKGLEQLVGMEASLERRKDVLTELELPLEKKRVEILQIIEAMTRDTTIKMDEQEAIKANAEMDVACGQKVTEMRLECEQERNTALNTVHEAEAHIETLSTGDIAELKAIKNPSFSAKKALEAACILKGQKVMRFGDEDQWTVVLKIVTEPSFFPSLKAIGKDQISPDKIKRVKKMFNDPDMEASKVERSSKAVYALYCWMVAVLAYDVTAKALQPKVQALELADTEHQDVQNRLLEKRQTVADFETQLANDSNRLEQCEAERNALEAKAGDSSQKISRAVSLVASLEHERVLWSQKLRDIAAGSKHFVGDALLAATVTTYLSVFPMELRRTGLANCHSGVVSGGVVPSPSFSLLGFLGDPVKVHSWVAAGLPNNTGSVDNGVIMSLAHRGPLCIDPQGEAGRWLKKMEQANALVVMRSCATGSWPALEAATQVGHPVLVEGVGEELDFRLIPLLQQRASTGRAKRFSGDAALAESNKLCRLFLTTKLHNPHYSPDICAIVTLVDFTTSSAGLQDQLLDIIVAKVKPEMSSRWSTLSLESTKHKSTLSDLEDRILLMMAESAVDLLEDERALDSLDSAKALSSQIKEEQEQLNNVEQQIIKCKDGHNIVAVQVGALFFALLKLSSLNPFYRTSLAFFLELFTLSCACIEDKDVSVSEWNDTLLSMFLQTLYRRMCPSLFTKHRHVLATLLAVELGARKSSDAPFYVRLEDYRLLLTTIADSSTDAETPQAWSQEGRLEGRAWTSIRKVAQHSGFEGLEQSFIEKPQSWRSVFPSCYDGALSFPGVHNRLSAFQKIIVLCCVHPHMAMPAVLEWTRSALGFDTLEAPTCDLARHHADSSCSAPLIFIMTSGCDPLAMLLQLAESKSKDLRITSMGQDQGTRAEKVISAVMVTGGWAYLQNCHLSLSWMPKLVDMYEQPRKDPIHADFRLWLSSYPVPDFPQSLMENSIKIAMEAPHGMKFAMRRLLGSSPICDDTFFDGCPPRQDVQWKNLLFHLLVAHGVILGRQRYGPIGSNRPYDFPDADLHISVQQLQGYLIDQPDQDASKVFRHLILEINYGARITEFQDHHLLEVLLMNCCRSSDGPRAAHGISHSKLSVDLGLGNDYQLPGDTTYEGFKKSLMKLPETSSTYGLHANAEVSLAQRKSTAFFADLLSSPWSSSTWRLDSDAERSIADKARSLLDQLPAAGVLDVILPPPRALEECMDIVLKLEISRYRCLLQTIRGSLDEVVAVCEGQLSMNAELEGVAKCISIQHTPKLWLEHSYLSMRPLAGYISDLIARLGFVGEWMSVTPAICWLSGLFCIHSLLMGLLRTFARRNGHAVDLVEIGFKIPDLDPVPATTDVTIFVRGLYLEGCRWDLERLEITEPEDTVVVAQCPMIWLVPCLSGCTHPDHHFECPLYVLPSRHEVLVQKSYQRNFVINIRLPSSLPREHWIRRGAAALTQLEA